MRYLFFIAVVFTPFSIIAARAQFNVDPGISIHNYKHTNKAEKAKAFKNERSGMIEVADRQKKQGVLKNSTPKYAVRPANLVISATSRHESNLLNPLTSLSNYKASNRTIRKTNH